MDDSGRYSRFALAVLLATFTLLLNQNCTRHPELGQAALSSEDPNGLLSFFKYNYVNKPNLYANLALVFPTESLGSFSTFNVHGIVTPADGSKGSITYAVDITDDAGNAVCSSQSGVLDVDQENFSFNCVGSATLAKANVLLKAGYLGQEETFQFSFSK